MRILLAHNEYQQRSGEDAVFRNEAALLASAGHDVKLVIVSNDNIKSKWDQLVVAARLASNHRGVSVVTAAIQEFRPDIVHVHNFFPLISPAIYTACRDANVPVVQTLHNYRPLCAAGTLERLGRDCRLCVHGSPIWGVVHRCYRGSLLGSASVARMIAVHRARGTWATKVDRYIALSEFGKRLFSSAGFPEDRIDIKPNFSSDPGDAQVGSPRRGVLFVGRVSHEKGIQYLVDACVSAGHQLRIIGTGPDLSTIRDRNHPNVQFLGSLSREDVLTEMKRSAVVAAPSVWPEPFGLVVIEALSCATPVVATNVGAFPEIVEDGITGIIVPPSDVRALALGITTLLDNPAKAQEMGRAARKAYLSKYTGARNLQILETIYTRTMAHHADI